MIAYTHYATDARVMKESQSASRAGFEVDFISLCRPGEKSGWETMDSVRVYRTSQKRYRGSNTFRYYLSYLMFFVRCFVLGTFFYVKKGYRIVHVNNMPDFLVFSMVIPKLFGANLILDIHDPMPHLYKTKFNIAGTDWMYLSLLSIERWSARFANAVITVNQPVSTDILAKDGIPSDKLAVVANFADGKLFQPGKYLPINNVLRLIYHGTIAERFGFDEILEALADFKDNGNVHLTILGEGDYQNTVKRIIREKELKQVVDFRNRFYPVNDLPEILQSHHVGMVCYRPSEATDYMLPVKLLELFAIGVPAIAVPNKAIRHYFPEELYFSYDPHDLRSFRNLLDWLIENPELINQKRNRILASREQYLWQTEEDKYVKLLKRFAA